MKANEEDMYSKNKGDLITDLCNAEDLNDRKPHLGKDFFVDSITY